MNQIGVLVFGVGITAVVQMWLLVALFIQVDSLKKLVAMLTHQFYGGRAAPSEPAEVAAYINAAQEQQQRYNSDQFYDDDPLKDVKQPPYRNRDAGP